MKLTVFFIFTLLSFSVLSETYICSHELSNLNRPGEIETMRFERKGNIFVGGIEDSYLFPHQIILDSKSFLILTDLVTNNSPSLTIVFINKDTKEWGGGFFTMEEFKKFPPSTLSYGKCAVVN